MNQSTSRTRLYALLRDGIAHHPLYPTPTSGPLTNHLPMALIALHALGGSATDLDDFQRAYSLRLVPPDPGISVLEPPDHAPAASRPDGAGGISLAADGWQQALGNEAAYGSFLGAFLRELQARGRSDVLRRVLPVLMQSVAVHALHPLIRTALATTHPVDEELAAALAYWCAAFRHLPDPVPSRSREGAMHMPATDHLFAELRSQAAASPPLQAVGFSARLAELAAGAQLAAVPARTSVDAAADLADLARESARIYLGTNDFFALHMVTGSHALRLLLGHLDAAARPRVLDRWWQALAATYLIINAPDYSRWRSATEFGEPPPRAHILASGLTATPSADGEHVVKLLHAASDEHAAYGFAEHARIVNRLCARWPPADPATANRGALRQ